MELLIVVSIFLILIGVSLTSLMNLKDLSDEKMGDYNAELTLTDIVNAVEAVCVMGEGNSRVIEPMIHGFVLDDSSPDILLLKYGGRVYSKNVSCTCSVDPTFDDSEVVIFYKSGGVLIK